MTSEKNKAELSAKAATALADFYEQYGSQTVPQKIKVLENELGESQFYASDGHVGEETKLACLECEWLQVHNLIDLDLA